MLLAACSQPAAREEPDPAPGSTDRPTGPTGKSSTVPVADPAHAVDPPGERDGRLWSADILVQWDKTIDDELLERIEALEGVAHTERIGLGQVSLENRVLTVASVDPGRYRNFTQAQVADFQEAWDRVAGGELAIDRTVAKRLADKAGMIRLGPEDDAPELHVGAYTPQVKTIDMVV